MTDPYDVLDYIAFHELWESQRALYASDAAFFVGMLGYRWGNESSARRYAARKRWFHQDRR